MAELGPGVTARDLVSGDPDELDRLAARLGVFGGGMTDAAGKLSSLDATGWRGPAADAFRGLLHDQPKKFNTAGSAFGEAVTALHAYTAVLRRAQADAGRAVTQYEGASQASQTWQSQRTAHANAVRTAHDAGEPPPAGPAPSSVDPGGADRAASQQLLSSARDAVHAQARTLASALEAAGDGAPHKPGLLHRVMHGIGDFFGGVWDGVKGLADVVKLAYELSPMRMMIDPLGWARDEEKFAKGLWWGVTHPVDFFKVLVDWNTWKTNPLRAFGKLIPTILIAIATDGAGAGAEGAEGAEAVEGAEGASAAARGGEGLGQADGALPDPGAWPKLPDPTKRPTWQESEGAVEDMYGSHGYDPQRSFKDGEEVPYGTHGSTRPELYRDGSSIEVKNYNVESSGGRYRLQQNLVDQAKYRAEQLPEGTVQHVIVDTRGQNVPLQRLVDLAQRIEEKSGGAIKAENIQFLR
jgi:hypothetical protein